LEVDGEMGVVEVRNCVMKQVLRPAQDDIGVQLLRSAQSLADADYAQARGVGPSADASGHDPGQVHRSPGTSAEDAEAHRSDKSSFERYLKSGSRRLEGHRLATRRLAHAVASSWNFAMALHAPRPMPLAI